MKNIPNGAIDLTTMPSALLARRLRSSLWCQKRVVAEYINHSMLSLLISPFIVMFLLWLLARHEAELSYYIIFFVVAGVSVAALVVGLASPWLGLGIYLIGLPLAIAKWCYVSLPKAVLVTFLFIVFQVGLEFVWDLLLSPNV